MATSFIIWLLIGLAVHVFCVITDEEWEGFREELIDEVGFTVSERQLDLLLAFFVSLTWPAAIYYMYIYPWMPWAEDDEDEDN